MNLLAWLKKNMLGCSVNFVIYWNTFKTTTYLFAIIIQNVVELDQDSVLCRYDFIWVNIFKIDIAISKAAVGLA